MTSIKSYTNLNKIINFYFVWLKANKQNYSPELIESLKKDPVLITLSLIWINKKAEDIIQFQTNRYFLDALNIKSLPNQQEIKTFISKIEFSNFLENNNNNNNNSNLESLGYYLIEQFNSSVGIDLSVKKKWDSSKKNFYEKNGYVVIPDVISNSECDDYRDTIIKIAKYEVINKEA